MKAYRDMMARVGGVLLLAGLFVAANAMSAEALVVAYACNDAACLGGDDVIVSDGSGSDLTPAAGIVTVAAFGVGIEIATSYPATGSPADPFLNLTYLLSSVPANPLYLYGTQDSFTFQSPPNLSFVANPSVGGQTPTAYGGAGTFVPPGAGGDVLSSGPALGPGQSFVDSFASPVAPYYLAIGLVVTPGGSGAASGDATILVPEPATIALFGLGLFGVGVASRRRRQAQAQVQ